MQNHVGPLRLSIVGLMLLAMVAGGRPAGAQTPVAGATGAATVAPGAKKTVTKKVVVKKTVVKKAGATSIPGAKTTTRTITTRKVATRAAPVVSPRHGVVPRRPVHPAAALVAAKPAAAAAVKVPNKPALPALPANEGAVTHLPVPRFASLKTDDVNMRSGPGARYPVEWVYKRRELPVKIEREFDIWRLVEDMDGFKGWVHQATLTGKRSFVITGTDPRTLRAQADATADAVAVLKPGVVGTIRICDATADWCQLQAGGYRGWLPRDQFWGTLPGEAVGP